MRITHVESYRIFQPAANPPFAWRRGLLGGPPDAEVAVLRIGTDAGVEGVAMLPRPGAGVLVADLVDRLLRDQLVGQDPLQRELHWHRIWELDRIEELPLPVLGLVDIALWDLAGRLAGAARLAVARRLPRQDRRVRLHRHFRIGRRVPRRGHPVR